MHYNNIPQGKVSKGHWSKILSQFENPNMEAAVLGLGKKNILGQEGWKDSIQKAQKNKTLKSPQPLEPYISVTTANTVDL